MNAAEFASRLLDLIASAVPEEATISKRLEAQIDALLDEFATPPEPVLKLDEDRRMVYGWASVISKNGTPIIDRQGDVVTTDDLREAVHDFMKHRTAGEMHDQMGVGEVVESFVLDAAVQKSLGIDLGLEGWYVGVHVPNDEVWAKVKKGDYKAFSIGGSAVREAIPDAESAGYTVVKGYKTLGDGTPDGDAKCPKCGKKHSARGCMAKFNPNHGTDGRFASGGGMRGAGRSSRSAGSKLTGSAGPAKKKPAKGSTRGALEGDAVAMIAGRGKRSYPKPVNSPGARRLYDALHDDPKAYILDERKTHKVKEGNWTVSKEKITWTLVSGGKRTKVKPAHALQHARAGIIAEKGPVKGSMILRAKPTKK